MVAMVTLALNDSLYFFLMLLIFLTTELILAQKVSLNCWSSLGVHDRVAFQFAEQARDFLLNGEIENVLNVLNLTKEQLEVLKPQINMANILGSFLGQFAPKKTSKLNVTYLGLADNRFQLPVTHCALARYLSAK